MCILPLNRLSHLSTRTMLNKWVKKTSKTKYCAVIGRGLGGKDQIITLMVSMKTTVDIEGFDCRVLEHFTVLPFIAAVMFTVKMEDRQYVGSEDCMLEAL